LNKLSHLLTRRRVLSWFVVGAFLTGMGAVMYVVLPPAPRWTLSDGVRMLITENGPALATCAARDDSACGPVQFWDVETGRELERFFADGPAFLAHAQSRDGRYFVAVLAGAAPDLHRVAWVDLLERKSWHVDAPFGEFDSALFSRTCRHLAVRLRKVGVPEAAYTVLDTATGRVIARFATSWPPPARQDDFWGRWPHGASHGWFTDDGRFFSIDDSAGETHAIRIVDTQSGKTTLVPDARLRALAPDARSLIAERTGATRWIWDLAAMAWHAPLEADAPDTLVFSPDGRLMASVPPQQKAPVALRVFDLRSGRLHWEWRSITWSSEGLQEEIFSADGRYFLLPTEPAPGQRCITMYDVPGKQMLWQRTWPSLFGSCLFTADSRTLISALRSSVEVVDAATGRTRFTIDLPDSVQLDPQLSHDGRTLYVLRQVAAPEPTIWDELMEAYRPWRRDDRSADIFPVYAYDLATGRELWRQESLYASQSWIAEDSLVHLHHHYDGPGPPTATTIQCWDLPPRKRLGWIIGTPLGVAALLLLYSVWRRHDRRRRSPAMPRAAR
jgi:outer membrane protein assembly factor BamB